MQVKEGRGVKVADVVLLCVWVSRGCLDGTAEWNETASRSRGGSNIPSMWISAHDRPVWSLSASEWIPWAEVRGRLESISRPATLADRLRSLESIVSE